MITLPPDPSTPILNRFLDGVTPAALDVGERIGVEGYPIPAGVEFDRASHALVDLVSGTRGAVLERDVKALLVPDEITVLDERGRTGFYLALLDRCVACDANFSTGGGNVSNFFDYGGVTRWLEWLQEQGVDRERTTAATFRWFGAYRFNFYGASALVRPLEWLAETHPRGLPEPWRTAVAWFAAQGKDNGGYDGNAYSKGAVGQAIALLGDDSRMILPAVDAWAAEAHREMATLDDDARARWEALLAHCATATSAKPSAKWAKGASSLVDEIGVERVGAAMLRWFPLADKPRLRPVTSVSWENVDERMRMNDAAATVLRGLVWVGGLEPTPDGLRAIGRLAISAYKKIRGLGPRAVKVGNACVWALGEAGGEVALGQLAMLKVRVKFGTAQKQIEKAFDALAASMGLPREEIEELGVPSYGLGEVGLLREELGEHAAEVRVDGSDVKLAFFKPDGKPMKSVPAAVKKEHADELKELKQTQKDVAGMLPAQASRLDALFLADKSWPIATWRERYLDHPLVGTLARRLIWAVDGTPAAWLDGALVDVDDVPLQAGEDATVRLWHPIDSDPAGIEAWRAWLERHRVTQPFKQAHRELYLLTDAERNTGTYSNRFAAHVIRQHQFNALCAARGWKNQLRLMVDDTVEAPRRTLETFGLRAEFWVEGVGEDYGSDTTESGAFLHLATDQVRFYPAGAARNYQHAGGGQYGTWGPDEPENRPLSLDRVHPLVLSEILRDVDLFVGVASVGNDPTWQDGGPDGRFRDYWQSYSFGDLGQTAKTRRAVLERLVPRLKIAERCSLTEKFLVVRGDVRTYKIHLGSGNILMEPNDQYLCIVPDRGSKDSVGDAFLPFEGDRTLSVIVSKALLLAADTKIKDPTILSQLRKR